MLRATRRVLVTLLAAGSIAAMAEEMPVDRDGWTRWQVPAGGHGGEVCCYGNRGAANDSVGCSLGDSERGVWTIRDCGMASDTMQLFVKLEDGRVRDVRTFSGSCPVDTGTPVRDLGQIPATRSIEWLLGELDRSPGVADEVLMAVAFHAESEALDALSAVLEARDRKMEVREQALFWLVQSDSDAAYAYLDRLLSRRAN